MAFQQSDLDALDQNIASGILETRFADGRTTRYQTLDMMVAARRMIADQLAEAEAFTRGATRRKYAAYRSGF